MKSNWMKSVIGVASVVVLGVLLYVVLIGNAAPQRASASSGHAGEAGVVCGGFNKNAPTCAAGFHCQLNTGRPDTGGVCVANTPGA